MTKVDEAIPATIEPLNQGCNKQLLSYKDKLLGFNGDPFFNSDDLDPMEEQFQESEEDVSGKTPLQVETKGDPTCPTIPISEEEGKEICKPWKLALIVKLLITRANGILKRVQVYTVVNK